MTHLLIFIFLSLWQHRSIDQISRHNLARKEAEAAYTAGTYKVAAERYAYLNRSPADGAVRLNAGHAYFRLNQLDLAREQYEALLRQDDPELASMAAVQLGVIACYQRDSATALTFFRQALLQNANSEPARYNFELIHRQYSGKPPAGEQPPPPRKAEQPTQASALSPSAGRVEHSERQDEQLNRFGELNMTEEQALHLLNAMQGNDLPFSTLRPFRGGRSGNSSASRNKNRW
ncbi:hypothetical protein GCM10023187_17150 [Nibrella viscosa]|uniref:Tetratricopeptide repeat-containing protein n=1 Tax=Nibrella viscosa TaxID=1084524 RepID=A0ABP8K8T3_9BACT